MSPESKTRTKTPDWTVRDALISRLKDKPDGLLVKDLITLTGFGEKQIRQTLTVYRFSHFKRLEKNLWAMRPLPANCPQGKTAQS